MVLLSVGGRSESSKIKELCLVSYLDIQPKCICIAGSYRNIT